MKKHEEVDQAVEAIKESIDEASQHEGFMAAVWHIKDDRVYMTRRTTWNFPTGFFKPSSDMLARSLKNEIWPEEPSALPEAEVEILE